MFRQIDQSTSYDTSSIISSAHNKDYYKKNKLSVMYKDFDPITGELVQQGEFRNGVEVGLWKVIDEDGDEQHFRYKEERVGARCQDGSYSSATGRGACSWHGGVAEWLYDNKRYSVGGTGKYEPIEARLQRAKQRLSDQLKINTIKNDQELFLQVANKLFKINPNSQLQQKQVQQKITAQISLIKSYYQTQLSKLQQAHAITQEQNLKLQEQNQQLKLKLSTEYKQSQNYQEAIQEMKFGYQEQLQAKQRQIQQLKKELKEAKIRGQKDRKKLDSSMTLAESQNVNIKNHIRLIQKQLAMLDKTLDVRQKRQKDCEDDQDEWESEGESESKQKFENMPKAEKSGLSTENNKPETKPSQELKPLPRVQINQLPHLRTSPKHEFILQTKPESKPQSTHELKSQSKQPSHPQSLETSQQSFTTSFNHQQLNINDSLSYSKILNSKLFIDENNKSELSMFLDLKLSKNGEISTRQDEKLNESRNEQKRMFRFKVDEHSSEEDEVALRTDDEEEENQEIFKSIPFKAGGSEVKKQGENNINKDKN